MNNNNNKQMNSLFAKKKDRCEPYSNGVSAVRRRAKKLSALSALSVSIVLFCVSLKSFALDITVTPMTALQDLCKDAFSTATLTENGDYALYRPYFFDANNNGCFEDVVLNPQYQFDVPAMQGERITPIGTHPDLSISQSVIGESGRYTVMRGFNNTVNGSTDAGIYLRDNTTTTISLIYPSSNVSLRGLGTNQQQILLTKGYGGYSDAYYDDFIYDLSTGQVLPDRRRPVPPLQLETVLHSSSDGRLDIIEVAGQVFARDVISDELTEIEVLQIQGLSPSSIRATFYRGEQLAGNSRALVWQASYDLPGATEFVSYLFYSDLNTGATTLIPNSESCPRDINRPELSAGNFCGTNPTISGNGRYVVFQQASSKLDPNPVNPPITGTVHPRGLAIYDSVTNTTQLLIDDTCSGYWDDDSLSTFCIRAGHVADIAYDGSKMVVIYGNPLAHGNPNVNTLPTLVEITPQPPLVPKVRVIAQPVYESDVAPHIAVRLGQASSNIVTVSLETVPIDANEATDYVAFQTTVVFAPGETDIAVPLTLVDDLVVESPEQFQVKITNVVGGMVDVGVATVIIYDNDSQRTVSIDDLSINEWEADFSLYAQVPVRLSQPADEPVTVQIKYTDISTTDADYAVVTKSLKIEPGETIAAVPLRINDDNRVESTETMSVELVAVSAGTSIDDGVATVSILDNDVPSNGAVSVIINDRDSILEQSSPFDIEISVVLLEASALPVTVTLASSSGTAIDGVDFIGIQETVSFAPGETYASIPMTILADSVLEEDEFFNVQITSVSGAFVERGVMRGIIKDDQFADSLKRRIVFGDLVVDEATSTAQVPVKLIGQNNRAVTITAQTRPMSATSGDDYVGVTQSIQILAGEREAFFPVSVVQDLIPESGESLRVEAIDVEGGHIQDPEDGYALVVITDDDAPVSTPSISIDDVLTTEGDGAVQIPLRLSQSSSQPIDVSVFTRSASAQGGADFYGFTQTVTFAAGTTTATVTLTILDDALVESNETLELRLFGASNGATIADGVGIVTIADNDQTSVPDISIDTVNFTEGDGVVQVPVRLSQVSNQTVQVRVFTRNVSAQSGQDFFGFTKTVTFSPGVTTANVSLAILDDSLAESTETLQLRLFSATGGTIVGGVGTVTIVDNDQPSNPSLSIDDASPGEGDGTVQVAVRLSQPSNQSVQVKVFTRAVSAMGGQDFYGFTKTLTFNPGSLVQTVSLTLLDDGLAEGNETLQLRLINAPGITITDGIGVVTIIDND